MKITNQLVTVLNVGLQDLFFESGLLTRLEEFNDQSELETYLSKHFTRSIIIKDGKEEEVIGEEEKMRDGLKQALTMVNIKNKEELLTLMETRYKVNLKSSKQAAEFAQNVRNDIATIVQVDKVLEGLDKLGLSKGSKKEIEKIKKTEITRLCDLLLVKVDEERNGENNE